MKFKREMEDRLKAIEKNIEIKNAAQNFMNASITPQYSYNFAWMGRPIIQYPQDMIAMQELIWEVKPDLIIDNCVKFMNQIEYNWLTQFYFSWFHLHHS